MWLNNKMKIKSDMIKLNWIVTEILQEYDESGMLVDYVNKNGNGINHLCFLTDSIESNMEILKASGFTSRQAKPSLGVRGKLRPTTTDDALDGIPSELSES